MTDEVPEVTETPAPTQIPEEAEKVLTLQDALDPNRYIDIWAVYDGDTLCQGVEVTLVAVLHGYDNLTYTLQWQVDRGDGAWAPIGQLNSTTYSFTLTEELYSAFWRVVVDITAGEV